MKKFKNFILFLAVFLISGTAFSQLIVINTFSPVGIRYEDTWKANITNPFSSQVAYVELEITKNNQQHLKAVSGKLELVNGITSIDFSKIKVEQIQFNNQNVLWNEFLTFGHYEICLRILSVEQQGKGEGCAPADIMPVSPPVVISPENEAEVGYNPIFSWAPPVPMNIFKNVCYDLKIVPVYPGQSGYEAMSLNNPVLKEPCITSLSFIYNTTNLPLEDGVEYAWQITAVDQGAEVSKSEVQTIKVKDNKEKPKVILIPKYYYKLRKTEDGNFGTAKGCIGFTCDEEKLDSAMKYKIFDNKSKPVSCDNLAMKKVGEENYFILELAGCNEFKAGQTYRLEVISPINKKYMIAFKYEEPE